MYNLNTLVCWVGLTMTSMKKEVTGSIQLHNQNAYRYFQKLVIPTDYAFLEIFNNKEDKAIIQAIQEVSKNKFDESKNYAVLFSNFFRIIDVYQNEILETRDHFKKANQKFAKPYNQFIISILENESDNLQETYKQIEELSQQQMPADKKLSKQIASHLDDPWSMRLFKVGENYPSKEEWSDRKVGTVFSSTFLPQQRTNIPHTFNYPAAGDELTQIRFGTQAQIVDGETRVAGAFKMFLAAKKDEGSSHIYFNCLGLDGNDTERLRESYMSQELHHLEEDHDNVFVITLPSDRGLMNEHDFKNTSDTNAESKKQVVDKFLDQMSLRRNKTSTTEFNNIYWSEKVEGKLFPNGEDESQKKEFFRGLINESIGYLGLQNEDKLTKAQQQAVYYHYIKFALTDALIQAINPGSINFSCKDAIDRGALASTYYNLAKSIQEGKPLTYEQFEAGLQAPASMVKARGMNSHIDRIWNVVNTQIEGNYERISGDDNKRWMIEWRDKNCPSSRVSALTKVRVKQATQSITELVDRDNSQVNQTLLKVIQRLNDPSCIKKCRDKDRLAVASTCMVLAQSPNNQLAIDRCVRSINKLPEDNRILNWIKGMLYIAVGHCISSRDPEVSKELIEKGNMFVKGENASSIEQIDNNSLGYQ